MKTKFSTAYRANFLDIAHATSPDDKEGVIITLGLNDDDVCNFFLPSEEFGRLLRRCAKDMCVVKAEGGQVSYRFRGAS